MKKQKYQSNTIQSSKEAPTLLDCPQCHSFISAENVNHDNHLAKCDHCNHVFNYRTDEYWDPFGPPHDTQPDGIDILKMQSLLDIHVKHRKQMDKSNTWMSLVFGLMWNAMLLPFLFYIITSGQWYILLFISMHLFFGITMLWNVMGTLFNKTEIEVTSDQLKIKTTPFAWPGRSIRKVETAEIDQLYVASAPRKKKKTGASYALYVLKTSGKKVLLQSGLDLKTLRYLEQQIESYLGIKDRKIRA